MKLFYLTTAVLSLFIIGCSHTYEVSKYLSKEELYKEFNESARDKDELRITFTNDSSIFVYNGATIKNDTIFLNACDNNSELTEIYLLSSTHSNFLCKVLL